MVNRREFVTLLGLGASTGMGSLQSAGTSSGRARSDCGPAGVPNSYGSGYFGEWITDQHCLPAYRYTCNQAADPKARTPVHQEWRSATDHTHQVGNDRLVAAVSNYGYVQVRQDEGAPKFLNDYSPNDNRYGAGVGFLTDGDNVLNTYYPGGGDSFERILGAGYLRKMVTGKSYSVDQVILAPFGDDPVLISQVSVTNHGNTAAKVRWVEYWGCHNYQLSYRSFMEAPLLGGIPKAAALRREFAERFEHQFKEIEHGGGLLESQKFLGRRPQEEQTWRGLQAYLKTNPTTFFGPPMPDLAADASMDDLNPPSTFLVSLDAPADAFSTNGTAFFGSGGVEHPSGLANKFGNDLGSKGPESALLLERDLELAPGETRTIYFMYGYLPEGFELAALMKKYRAGAASRWQESSARWKADGLRLRVPSEPWVERETTWHNYYLRSSLTYDSFFREHILSQGHVYQYIFGFQGAARDPLQHVLPFIFTHPELVREILRYTLKEMQPDGSIPYGIVGSGVPMPSIFHPSDLELWLLWVASEYVLATRDTDFLEEKIPTYPRHEANSADATIRELLARSYNHLLDNIGAGEHGLMRLLHGDWNDAVVVSPVPPQQLPEVRKHGESVLNAAMACYVLEHYARLLRYIGDPQMAGQAHAKAEAQRQAVRAQWCGRWFRRAWLCAQLGWLGEEQLWLEPQPWAIIGAAATPEQSKTLVKAMDELLRKPSPIGALYQNKGLATSHMFNTPLGTVTNAGVWPSLNGTLIWALSLVDGGQAWDEWKKNTLALHAEAYPDVWYGIWSGPDTYNSVLSKYPGQTMFAETDAEGKPGHDLGVNWTDSPVMNMHPHAWPLYSAAKLLGLEFHESGLRFAPVLPLAEYEFASPLLGFKKSGHGYSGWYAPVKAGRWEIELRLAQDEAMSLRTLEVNGNWGSVPNRADTAIRFEGENESGKPLCWKVW